MMEAEMVIEIYENVWNIRKMWQDGPEKKVY